MEMEAMNTNAAAACPSRNFKNENGFNIIER